MITDKQVEQFPALLAMTQEERVAFIERIAPAKPRVINNEFEPVIAVQEPGLFKKATSYITAKVRHHVNGAPKCTDEQVEERFKICLACPSKMYVAISAGAGKCKKCGCGVMNAVAEKGDSKLRWADESCPLKHWLRND